MSALEKEQNVELKPEVSYKDGKVIVTYPENVYLDMANEFGINEKQLKEYKKFDNEFTKQITVATADAIVEGYQKHKDATEHEMEYRTPMSTISIHGKKLEHHKASGVDYVGLRVNITRDILGLKATVQAKKKEMFATLHRK